MYSKLSFRNMKRSLSDYAIYFVTLMMAVCMFYAFNSLSAQRVLLELSDAQNSTMGYLDNMITLASVLISVIFCVLCVFANQFLIKRRKREFGLYMSLGMGKLGVTRILMMETLLIGMISLVTGIGAGILVSQGMAVFTSSLFNIPLVGYEFIYSSGAMMKTVVFFGVVYSLVIIFNIIAVSKYTLIELLTVGHNGNICKQRNPILNGILFVVSMSTIGAGYVVLLRTDIHNGFTGVSLGLGLIMFGSLIFYLFGISFILTILKKNKKFSYKQIHLFNIQQMRAKIDKGVVSLAITSVLLFFTVSILTNAMSYKKTMENELDLVAPFDASLSIYNVTNGNDRDIEEVLLDNGIDITKDKYHIMETYHSDIDATEMIKPYALGEIKNNLEEGFPINASVIGYSDYVVLAKLQGIKPVVLNENQTIILSNMNEAYETIDNLTHELLDYVIGDRKLSLTEVRYQRVALETETQGRNLICFVVPDIVTKNLDSKRKIINIQYSNSSNDVDNEYVDMFHEFLVNDPFYEDGFYARGMTKTVAIDLVTGETTNLLYVGIYLGIVFLVTCGTVLGLRLLSDASDEQSRYKIVKRLGATDKMIRKSVFAQVFTYFIAPLTVAIPNAIIISIFITKQLVSAVDAFTIFPAVVTAFILLILYGTYFVITLNSYHKIVNS